MRLQLVGDLSRNIPQSKRDGFSLNGVVAEEGLAGDSPRRKGSSLQSGKSSVKAMGEKTKLNWVLNDGIVFKTKGVKLPLSVRAIM